MKVVCEKCEIEFRPEKNGVHVHELMCQDTEIYKIWDADLWKCPGCGMLVVAGFGQKPLAEHFEEAQMRAVLDAELDQHTTVIYDREHLKEKK